MGKEEIWEKCVAFHGHECGGLAIGYRAALYAGKLLQLDFSKDEEVVCISENDACGVDAVQVILGCSVGKGNLLFHIRGKQAFSFINRQTGKSVRLLLRDKPQMSREESLRYYRERQDEELFEVKEMTMTIPEPARIFTSVHCEGCGETTAEHMIRLQNGKKLCLDCYQAYDRFHI